MGKTLSTACKATGAVVLLGMLVFGACLFSESSRSYYPPANRKG